MKKTKALLEQICFANYQNETNKVQSDWDLTDLNLNQTCVTLSVNTITSCPHKRNKQKQTQPQINSAQSNLITKMLLQLAAAMLFRHGGFAQPPAAAALASKRRAKTASAARQPCRQARRRRRAALSKFSISG
jgi:hypothetical protein